MGFKENKQQEDTSNIINEDGGVNELYKAASERNIRLALSLNYTERFKIMMRLMRIDKMFSQAKITHKKMP